MVETGEGGSAGTQTELMPSLLLGATTLPETENYLKKPGIMRKKEREVKNERKKRSEGSYVKV